MERGNAIKILGLILMVSLCFIQSANGAEKSLIIKVATLAPEGSSWMKTFNTLSNGV